MILDASQGKTKILFDPETKRVIGAAIVGPAAGDLISEACLAIEMGSDAEDVGLTIHPHPTLEKLLLPHQRCTPVQLQIYMFHKREEIV